MLPENAKTLGVNITGTPTAVVESGTMTIRIPGAALNRGEDLDVTESLSFAIAENSMTGVYIAGIVGGTPNTGNYWKYSKTGAEISSSTFDSVPVINLAIVGDDIHLTAGGKLYKKNDAEPVILIFTKVTTRDKVKECEIMTDGN
jgi:hypothetical protein